MYKYFYDRFYSYGYENSNSFSTKHLHITLFADEYNLSRYCDIEKLNQLWHKLVPWKTTKNIIAGMYDGRGHMTQIIIKNPTFKVVEYPWQRCRELFTDDRINQLRNSISPKTFIREFECGII